MFLNLDVISGGRSLVFVSLILVFGCGERSSKIYTLSTAAFDSQCLVDGDNRLIVEKIKWAEETDNGDFIGELLDGRRFRLDIRSGLVSFDELGFGYHAGEVSKIQEFGNGLCLYSAMGRLEFRYDGANLAYGDGFLSCHQHGSRYLILRGHETDQIEKLIVDLSSGQYWYQMTPLYGESCLWIRGKIGGEESEAKEPLVLVDKILKIGVTREFDPTGIVDSEGAKEESLQSNNLMSEPGLPLEDGSER